MRPICPGLSLATAFFVDGLIVACTVAVSDYVHRTVDPSDADMGTAFAAHVFSAFAIYVGLHISFYVLFWYGRGDLAARRLIKQPSCVDFWGCPPTANCANCFAPWCDTLDADTYVTPTAPALL